jgi:trans-aconitate 2-methyltransferase
LTRDFDGERYKRASRHQKEWGLRLIESIEIGPRASILDLGCGDGVLTAEIARRAPRGRVLGIDSSPSMLEAAQALATDNLRFERMDINDIDFTSEFDVVFSNATLHWIKDHARLLRRVHAALRPGGRLRFNFAGAGNCQSFFAVVREMQSSSEFASYFEDFEWPWLMPGAADYAPLLHDAGFVDIVVREENADRFFSSKDEMTAWLDQPSLVPFLRHLPADVGLRFRGIVVRRMIKRTRRADGRCFETFRRVDVAAKKV